MSLAQVQGTRTIVLSTGVAAASSGAWRFLGGSYSRFALRCVRAGSVGTSNFSVSIRGALSTQNTTGAAVGAIAAYTPSTLISYTQALVGKVKVSTGLVPVTHIKYVVASMTTAANRKLRIEICCVP
jgi:hypothetical protein